VSITEYLDEHPGETLTEQQIADGTGQGSQFVGAFMRAAADRDWAERVPGGWRLP
jgi:hypothetical protein